MPCGKEKANIVAGWRLQTQGGSRTGGAAEAVRGGPRVRWLFLDLNSYFASVEQELRPELRGRPIAVVPVVADSGTCIAASYEAKAFGVKTGVKVGEAKRLCPGLELVEGAAPGVCRVPPPHY